MATVDIVEGRVSFCEFMELWKSGGEVPFKIGHQKERLMISPQLPAAHGSQK